MNETVASVSRAVSNYYHMSELSPDTFLHLPSEEAVRRMPSAVSVALACRMTFTGDACCVSLSSNCLLRLHVAFLLIAHGATAIDTE